MASSSAKECGICNEEYNEEKHCPRILPCFHCLCADCIDQLIRKNAKNCPFCRQNFEARSARDFRINNNTLDLMKYIADLEANAASSPCRSPSAPPLRRIYDFKRETEQVSIENLVNCQRAEYQIQIALRHNTELRDSLQQDTLKTKKEILVQINEIAATYDGKVEEIEEENRKLKEQLKEIIGKQKQMREVKEKLDGANSFEAGSLLDEAEDANRDIEMWLHNFHGFIAEDEKTRQEIGKYHQKAKHKINRIQEILNYPSEGETDIDLMPGMTAMSIYNEKPLPVCNEKPLPISFGALREMNCSLKCLVEQGLVYAVKQHEGRQRCARLSITMDNKLCLHHLKDESLPPNVHVVEHIDAMKLVDSSSRLTFLEFGASGSSIGRVYIRLAPDTKRATHFSYLCTGELGPDYVYSSILKVGDKGMDGEYLRCGDYEFNDGSGGKSLIPGLWNEYGKEYKRPLLAGTVAGRWLREWSDSKVAQFYITTREDPGEVSEAAFGIVEEGLCFLTEALPLHRSVKDIQVNDCGIVLSILPKQEFYPTTKVHNAQNENVQCQSYGFL